MAAVEGKTVKQEPVFEIGLVMAGAISAGAYTAGVVDFLIEALNAYEAMKADPTYDGPRHSVKIPVLAGASAGGMTAAVCALQFFRKIEHVRPGKPAPAAADNRLYDSWVRAVSLDQLLDTTDLDRKGAPVKSVLCSDVLDEIVKANLDGGPLGPAPAWVGGRHGEPLRLVMSLTNLSGIPYTMTLTGGNFGMFDHGDFLSFDVADVAPPEDRGGIWLDRRNLGKPEWHLFADGALATGAFPLGLAPRHIMRNFADYQHPSKYFADPETDAQGNALPLKEIPADFRAAPGQNKFMAVDGGVVDNEPLERARQHLARYTGARNERNGEAANRAVILIDPFPNIATAPAAVEVADAAAFDIVGVARSLLGAMIDQSRFKVRDLQLATNETVFSRFSILPSRGDMAQQGAPQIACGELGGFSGFLHESFRRHDYLLGRRNAQAFLLWHLVLPETNTLFDSLPQARREKWYTKRHGKVERSQTLASADGSAGQSVPSLPIIPLRDKLAEEIILAPSDFPNFTPRGVLEDLHDRLEKRLGLVVDRLYDDHASSVLGGFLATVASFVARPRLRKALVEKAEDKISAALQTVDRYFKPPRT